MELDIETLYKEAIAAISAADDPETVKQLSIRYLGRKGAVTGVLRSLRTLPPEIRPTVGQRANEVKAHIEEAIRLAEERIASLLENREAGIDISLPGRKPTVGGLHPLTQTTRIICDIFTRMGFHVAEGPEIELDRYNFEALNIPKHHPARDMQDTFYVSEDVVLRTHTSPIQVRYMEAHKPPLKIVAPGKVYRCDSDITHTPMFHQIEGLVVGEHVTFSDLKGTLTAFVHQMFDTETALRFRPSFFPFTEPSAEVDIRCVMCRGSGCRVCSHTGWLEILGSGMVHPAVLENVGYDSAAVTGFAFGMGIERIAMLKFGIDDIRKFFENDIRFLHPFRSGS